MFDPILKLNIHLELLLKEINILLMSEYSLLLDSGLQERDKNHAVCVIDSAEERTSSIFYREPFITWLTPRSTCRACWQPSCTCAVAALLLLLLASENLFLLRNGVFTGKRWNRQREEETGETRRCINVFQKIPFDLSKGPQSHCVTLFLTSASAEVCWCRCSSYLHRWVAAHHGVNG